MITHCITILGPSGCGKTTLLNLITSNDAPLCHTVAPIQRVCIRENEGNRFKLRAYEIPGSPKFASISQLYIDIADLVLVCFDLGDYQSFLSTIAYINNAQIHAKRHALIALCGLKADE